jgi:hypothetical protein
MRSAARSEDGGEPADALSERLELQAKLAQAVAALAEPYRSTIGLRYFEGLPPRKIAARQGVSVVAVETRLRRGLEALRSELDAMHAGERESWFSGMAAVGALAPVAARSVAATAAAAIVLVTGVAAGAAIWPRGSAASIEQTAAVAAPAVTDEAVEPVDVALATHADERAVVVIGAHTDRVHLRFVRAHDDAPLSSDLTMWLTTAGEGTRSFVTDAGGAVKFSWDERWTSARVRFEQTGWTNELAFDIDGPGERVISLPNLTGSLSGRVRDLEGNPVPFAEVRMWSEVERANTVRWHQPQHVVEADAAGAFRFGDLPIYPAREWYTVMARAPGAISVHARFGSVSGQDEGCTLLVGEAWDIRGRVSSAAGPVADAPLLAYCRGMQLRHWRDLQQNSRDRGERPEKGWGQERPPPNVSFATEEDGSFEIPFTAEPWHVQVDHEEYPRWRGWVEGAGFLDIRLGSGVELSGRVRAADGSAVAGAEVTLRCRDERPTEITADDGTYLFTNLTPLEGALVSVLAEGHACRVETVDLGPGPSVRDVRLEAEEVIEGRVVDSSGAPVVHASVEVRGERIVGSAWMPRSRGMRWERLDRVMIFATDEDGRFRCDGLYPGTYRLRVLEYRDVLSWASVRSGARDVELRIGDLSGTLTVRGTVVDESAGRAPGEFFVTLVPFVEGEEEGSLEVVRARFEGGDGSFEFKALDPGLWQVNVRVPGRRTVEGPVERMTGGPQRVQVSIPAENGSGG